MYRTIKLFLTLGIVLSLALTACGSAAPANKAPAALKITGRVANEQAWSEADVKAMNTLDVESTNKAGETSTYTGVLIADLLAETAGSIYCGRDWGLRGNVIRHNFFHHIKSSLPGSNGVHAVYLDDCASGITVFGNTFYEISGRAIMCGGGRDNIIENNVIAKCGAAHFTDRRGKVWIDKDNGSWRLLDKIKKYNYTEPPWSTRYPALAHILDHGYEQAKEPEGCVIRCNLGWQNKRWLQESSLGAPGGFQFYTIENNLEDQDPHFADEASLNLALRDDSPAYTMRGFQRIPFASIGPQEH